VPCRGLRILSFEKTSTAKAACAPVHTRRCKELPAIAALCAVESRSRLVELLEDLLDLLAIRRPRWAASPPHPKRTTNTAGLVPRRDGALRLPARMRPHAARMQPWSGAAPLPSLNTAHRAPTSSGAEPWTAPWTIGPSGQPRRRPPARRRKPPSPPQDIFARSIQATPMSNRSLQSCRHTPHYARPPAVRNRQVAIRFVPVLATRFCRPCCFAVQPGGVPVACCEDTLWAACRIASMRSAAPVALPCFWHQNNGRNRAARHRLWWYAFRRRWWRDQRRTHATHCPW